MRTCDQYLLLPQAVQGKGLQIVLTSTSDRMFLHAACCKDNGLLFAQGAWWGMASALGGLQLHSGRSPPKELPGLLRA